jgi:hypothetical protein
MCFVAVVVQSRLAPLDRSLEEAAMDLGCNPVQAFLRVTLPLIFPAIAAGWMLAFTLSLDDVVIASFTTGPGSATLPIRIYSEVRLGVKPEINAICTIMIAAVAIGVVAAALVASAGGCRQRAECPAAGSSDRGSDPHGGWTPAGGLIALPVRPLDCRADRVVGAAVLHRVEQRACHRRAQDQACVRSDRAVPALHHERQFERRLCIARVGGCERRNAAQIEIPCRDRSRAGQAEPHLRAFQTDVLDVCGALRDLDVDRELFERGAAVAEIATA